MEKTQKLIRVYNQVIVKQVYIFETQEQEYKHLNPGSDEEAVYGYVDVPGETKLVTKEEILYDQKFDEGDLNVRELALWTNRVK